MNNQEISPKTFDANRALTAEELEEVTGYKSPRKQRETLDKAGIYCIFKKATNRVWTNWHHVNNPKKVGDVATKSAIEPNFGAINGKNT